MHIRHYKVYKYKDKRTSRTASDYCDLSTLECSCVVLNTFDIRGIFILFAPLG